MVDHFDYMLKFLESDLQRNGDSVNVLSKAYFFDQTYAEHRNGRTISDPPQSVLSFLLQHCMSEEIRNCIFPGDFDLGNMKVLPPELCTYEKLADSWHGVGRNGLDASDAFETIKKGISEITGRSMQEHCRLNASTALKVVKTLGMISRNRFPRVMQLLRHPSKEKFSLSFRDAHPYEKNKEQVWLIADIKAYLSAELNNERIEEINKVFVPLYEVQSNIQHIAEDVISKAYRSGARYADMVNAYNDLSLRIAQYSISSERVNIPLDEELFIYINRLEYSHYAVGYPELVKYAFPKRSITSVVTDLSTLVNKAFPALFIKAKINDERIAIKDVSQFLIKWQPEIIAIVEKAVNESIGLKDFHKFSNATKNYLINYYAFEGSFVAAISQEKETSLLFIVAAMCCAWVTLLSPITDDASIIFEPYWLGQGSQGGRVSSSVKASFTDANSIDNLPEEHRQILRHQLIGFTHLLCGYDQLIEEKYAFWAALVKKMHEIIQTNNTDLIAKNLTEFSTYVNNLLLQHQNN